MPVFFRSIAWRSCVSFDYTNSGCCSTVYWLRIRKNAWKTNSVCCATGIASSIIGMKCKSKKVNSEPSGLSNENRKIFGVNKLANMSRKHSLSYK